jgi:hypothetical protein
MQKFSKSGCVTFLVACPLLIVAVHRYLPPDLGEAHIWFSVASGVLLATGLSSLWLLLTGSVETRADVLQMSESAQPPADGEAVLVTGRVRAAPPLLTAPLSGTPCVAYFYRMYRLGMKGPDRGSSHTEELPVYWGYASRPLVVDTRIRAVAVAAPQLSLPRNRHAGDEVVTRAREYVRTVAAEVRKPQRLFAGDPVMQWMTDISPDEDGSARLDWKSEEEEDPATLLLEELVLIPEAEVSVHGRWSARRNAMWVGEGAGDVPPTLALGPATAFGVGAGVPPSLLSSWIGTLITIALGVGVIWFAKNVWPQLK